MADIAGTVEQLWRYPIKSTGGERLSSVEVNHRGVAGDRLYAVRDAEGKFGSGKSTRRFRRMDGLLHLSSRYRESGGEPELIDPHGHAVADATAFIRAYLGRDDVEVAREGDFSHFDQLPLSILTTATLDWIRQAVPDVPIDERRFRPNILLRTPPGTPPFIEDDWFGRKARVGDTLRVELLRSSERCVMTNQAQQDLPHSPLILKAVAATHDNRLDGLARVINPGSLQVGDSFMLE